MISTTDTYVIRSFTPGAPPASFSFDFNFEQTTEIYCLLYGTGLPGVTLTQGVDYTVSPTPPNAGGTISVIGPNWAAGYSAYGNLRIYRNTAQINGTSVVNGGAIDANVLEFVIDELTQMMQEQSAGGIQSIFNLTAPITDPPGLNYVLPAASVRAMTGVLFDANGNVVAGSPTAAIINAAWQAALAQGTVSGLLSGIGALITVNTSVSNTPAALNGNYFYNVGAAGATTQNFSAGATEGGMQLFVYNRGAGTVTVTLSGSLSVTLLPGWMTSWIWNGTAWQLPIQLRRVITTSGALGTLVVTGDTDFFLSATSSATLPANPPSPCRLTFKNKGSFTSTISANAGQTIGTTSSTSFVLYGQEDYVTLEWDGVSIWYVVATNGPVQSSSQTATTNCNNSSAWTAIGNGLSLGSLPAGVYDLEMDLSLGMTNVNGDNLSAAIGNGTSPISSAVGGVVLGTGMAPGYPAHVCVKNYILSGAATIQGIYYSNNSSNSIDYSAGTFVGKITARRIG